MKTLDYLTLTHAERQLGCRKSSSFYLFIKQFHKNMTADNTQTGLTRLAKHTQWPQ